MNKTITYTLIAIVMLCQVIYAHPQIQAFLYDPNGADTGFEWIELYNPINSTTISNIIIEKGNGAKVNDWTVVFNATNITILANQYFLIGEDQTNPDYSTKLVLGNGPDAIRITITNLLDNTTTHETVGYGSHEFEEYYQEEPAKDIASLTLVRINQTKNNALDFTAQNYTPHSSLYQVPDEKNVTFELTIPNSEPAITDVIIEKPDLYPKDGYQITLVDPSIPVRIVYDDENGFEDITNITIELFYIESKIAQTTANFANGTAYGTLVLQSYPPGNYSLLVIVQDTSHASAIHTQTITILPTIGFLPQSENIEFEVINKTHQQSIITIKNTGNIATRTTIQVKDSTLDDLQLFLENSTDLSINNSLLLQPLESKTLKIIGEVPPRTKPGTYNGMLQFRTSQQ